MRIKTKTILAVMLGLAVVAVLSLFGWRHFSHRKSSSDTPSHSRTVNGVNYGPATDAQKKAGEQIKQQTAPGTSNDTPSTGPQTTTVTIVRLNQIEAGQNVNLRANLSSNVTGGQCVATFTQSGQTPVSVTTGIASNPTYFSCEPIDISASKLTGGAWQVTVYVEQNGSIVSNKATGSITVKQ